MAARREEGEHFLVQSHCTWTQGGARVPLCGALASEQADDNLWRGGTQQTLTNLAPCSENLSFEVSSCPRFFPSAKINSIKPNFTLHAAEAFSSLEVSRSLSLLEWYHEQPGRLKKCFDLVYSCIRFFKWPQLCCSINVQTHYSSMGTISQGSGVFLLQPMSIQTANTFGKYHFHFFFL